MHCETLSNERAAEPAADCSEAARKRLLSGRGEPLFLADWLRAVFIHYEVPAAALQLEVPFEIDVREGKAYVSLVAFTMRRMRPFHGGKLGAWLFHPFAGNDFLNVRTYVRHRGETGIFFLREWMNNPLTVSLGPPIFGLPYRFGELNYHHEAAPGRLHGVVCEKHSAASLKYEGALHKQSLAPCPAGSLDEFLLERYTAFTAHKARRRFFRIWHSPWPQTKAEIDVTDISLLEKVWPWFREAKFAGANFSPGARDVWMGRPHRVLSPNEFRVASR